MDDQAQSDERLMPLLRAYAMAGIAALVLLSIPLDSVVWPLLNHPARVIARLVPSIELISGATRSPESSRVILVVQWLFTPAYLWIWFTRFPPWRLPASTNRPAFTVTQRYLLLPLGILLLAAWALGDIGAIDFPTFVNGKVAYPPATARHFHLIYASQLALALYAWIGPIIETGIVWMLSMCVLNPKTYFSRPHPPPEH